MSANTLSVTALPETLFAALKATARRHPDRVALSDAVRKMSYSTLVREVQLLAAQLTGQGLCPGDRVAIYLPKTCLTVTALLAVQAAGGVVVPINPVLKQAQVRHILRDSGASMLISQAMRLQALGTLEDLPDLGRILDLERDNLGPAAAELMLPSPDIEDLAALLYTSGSTGRAKGVMLSHRNLVAGAAAVADYLGNGPEDRLLSVLPLSFDYGLSQLTTALLSGAQLFLLDYLGPRDVMNAIEAHRITGLACVPPLWTQLNALGWSDAARSSLRCLTNSGGKLPVEQVRALRSALPDADLYLMYGLTEAFRSTYLPPDLVDEHPESIGRAIPLAEILVVRPDGTPCADGEPGELVHMGPLVAQGYWNDPERTAERFRPAPTDSALGGMAVWSGDTVTRETEGLLRFIGRDDEMIKCSGYRLSPTEVEDALYQLDGVFEAAVFGWPDDQLGEVPVAVVAGAADLHAMQRHCQRQLPGFMVPRHFHMLESLPKSANGKIDRAVLKQQLPALMRSEVAR